MSDPNNGAMTGSDRINHAGAIGSQKYAAKRGGISPSATHGHPLYGLGQAQEEIIRASGLGRRTPDGRTRGEQMSDADGATQDVQVKDGKAVHRKVVNGGVRETPILHYDVLDPYENLDQPNSAKLATLQHHAGYPIP